MSKMLRRTLIGFSLLAACLAGFAIHSRYFDEAGGAFCEVVHEAVQLRNEKICRWTGVSLELLTLLRTDVRNSADPHRILIKYSDGIVYQCFWFDVREFDYLIDGLKPSSSDGCSDSQQNLIMTRKGQP